MKNFIFGIRSIIEAVSAGKTIDKVLIKQNLKGELISELLRDLKKYDIQIQYVPIEKINKITTKNHQGVVAFVSPVEYFNLEDIVTGIFEKGKIPLLLILDSITDVRNFGAIARTSECAGVDAIIIPERNSVSITSDAIKTSAGALNSIPVCKEKNLFDTIILLQQMGVKVVAASEKAGNLLYNEDLKLPLAIMLGSEEKGISNQMLRKADSLVKIPVYGNIDSLNVSVAAALFIYEAKRQRDFC